MRKLLSVNFRRAFLRGRFIIGGGFPAIIGCIVLYNMWAAGENQVVDRLPYEVVAFLPMLFGITGGLYISQDYANNTIRNKIIGGHSRVSIYFSNWITSMLGAVIIYGAYLLVTLGIGSILVGVSDDFDLAHNVKSILLEFCILLNFTSITVMLCMIIGGIGGTVMSCLAFEFLGMSSIIIFFVDNASFAEFFINVNPVFQIDSVSAYAEGSLVYEEHIHISWIPISSLISTVLTTALGLRVFIKKDIK